MFPLRCVFPAMHKDSMSGLSHLQGRTTRITGRRELMLIPKPTGHRRSLACDGSSLFCVAKPLNGGIDLIRFV